MIALRGRCETNWAGEPFIARIGRLPGDDTAVSGAEVLMVPDSNTKQVTPAALLQRAGSPKDHLAGTPVVKLPISLNHLEEHDVVRISPTTGDIAILYRRRSNSNVIFTTERCNSDCVMCSQPPRDVDDGHLIDIYLEAIRLMHPDTMEIGITGGEPTLLGSRLFELIETCRTHLPQTSLHMLSNGRLFNYLSLAKRLAEVQHPDLMVGIPLYSDVGSSHDFVVQAAGAFDQTVRGILNLKRCDVPVEIRVVLHRLTIARLTQLCEFISRNLPMVDHVALMGLESIGYVKMNQQALWIDPVDYQAELVKACRILGRRELNVSIYNHQLCVLDRELWPYARQSISDWKNDFDDACESCGHRDECGGFFGHTLANRSRGIRPIETTTLTLIP